MSLLFHFDREWLLTSFFSNDHSWIVDIEKKGKN
jgi:hypothetical protein